MVKKDQGDIRNIRGVGDRLFEKIMTHFGGEEEFIKAVENYEVDSLASIEGISQRRAVEIINVALGNPTESYLKTDRALQIYDDILEKILQFTNTNYAKNRILLLTPTKNQEEIEERVDFVMNAKNHVSKLPLDELRILLKKVDPIINVKQKYNPSQAILVESSEDYHRLIDLGLNKYNPIMTSEEIESLDDFELIIYVYSEGRIELDEAPNVTMVNQDAQEHELAPDSIISYFKENHSLLSNILKIKEILGRESELEKVLDILDSLETSKVDEGIFDEAVDTAKKNAELKLKEAIKNVNLKGDEILDLLNKGMPPKIKQIFDDIIKDSRDEIKEKTGCYFDPFLEKYPIEIDETELERVKKQEISRRNVKLFEEKVKAAEYLSHIKNEIEEEIQEILLFDYEFSLGCFAYYYDLQKPVIGGEFKFKEGLHLNLALNKHERIQKIDYTLKLPDNVVLLTGANSGGKTTLLETLAQISIMTQMGLPVCAREAEIQLVDEVYFFSKKHSLDAGAFESFLNTFMPIVTVKTDKLILLDELEAITELEAAVKIIASFMGFIRDSNSYAVIVTHMAREILKYIDVRVDGIEAQGLDENYNLIVDRTPKINYFAKSTPELILRRMYQKSDSELKEVYRQILEKF